MRKTTLFLLVSAAVAAAAVDDNHSFLRDIPRSISYSDNPRKHRSDTEDDKTKAFNDEPQVQYPPSGLISEQPQNQYSQPQVQYPPSGLISEQPQYQYSQPQVQYPPSGLISEQPQNQYSQPQVQYPASGLISQPEIQYPPSGLISQPQIQYPASGLISQPEIQYPPSGLISEPQIQYPPSGLISKPQSDLISQPQQDSVSPPQGVVYQQPQGVAYQQPQYPYQPYQIRYGPRRLQCANSVRCHHGRQKFYIRYRSPKVYIIRRPPIYIAKPQPPIVIRRPQPPIVIPGPKPRPVCHSTYGCRWRPGAPIPIPIPQPLPPIPQPLPPIPQPLPPVCPTSRCRSKCTAPSGPGPSCYGHSGCSGSNACCWDSRIGGTQCTAPRPILYDSVPYPYGPIPISGTLGATASRTQRELEVTNNGSASVLFVLNQWADENLTALITELMLPLKMDLGENLQVDLATDLDVNEIEQGCSVHEANCIGSLVLSCAMKEELTPQGEANSSSVDMETPMPEQGQIRLLSLSACLMQTFAAGMIQRKQNGLLAAKRCVRSHKYNWSDIRTCVRDVPLLNTPAQNVTQNSGLNLLGMKASLCSSLEAQNVSSVICDLAADEFENTIGSSGISSDFVDIIDSHNMPSDSANAMGNSYSPSANTIYSRNTASDSAYAMGNSYSPSANTIYSRNTASDSAYTMGNSYSPSANIIDSSNMPLDSVNTMGNSDSPSYLANRIGSSVLPSNPVLTSGSSDISLDSVNSQPTLEHSDFVHYNNVLNQDSYMNSNINDDPYY